MMTTTGGRLALVLAAAAIVAGCGHDHGHGTPGAAGGGDHAHGPGGAHTGTPLTDADVAATPTLADCVRALEQLGMTLDAHVHAGTLAKVHRVAEEAAIVATRAVEKVQAEVAADRRMEATKAARAVAALFPDLDKAGDSGHQDEVARLLGVYRGHVAALRAVTPGAAAGAAGPGVAIDPVCRMEVEQTADALTHEHGGQTYWFCNASCRERFAAAPATFGK